MDSSYLNWLCKQGVPLFEAGGIHWRVYSKALIPASIEPCYVNLSSAESHALLRTSGAWFLRYSSHPSTETSEWWYVICDSYEPKNMSSKTRQNISRGNRSCSAKFIEPKWLAEHGYPCYRAAYDRYKGATAMSEDHFKREVMSSSGGPFEYWGAFVGDHLAGYCKCILERGNVNTSVTKYDPAYLKFRSAYALVTSIIRHYVGERGMAVNNGNRAIVHDTNYQEFLVNLGFRREFCRLNVIYSPWLRSLVRVAFPFQRVFKRAPNCVLGRQIKSLLLQEELRRLSFAQTAANEMHPDNPLVRGRLGPSLQ